MEYLYNKYYAKSITDCNFVVLLENKLKKKGQIIPEGQKERKEFLLGIIRGITRFTTNCVENPEFLKYIYAMENLKKLTLVFSSQEGGLWKKPKIVPEDRIPKKSLIIPGIFSPKASSVVPIQEETEKDIENIKKEKEEENKKLQQSLSEEKLSPVINVSVRQPPFNPFTDTGLPNRISIIKKPQINNVDDVITIFKKLPIKLQELVIENLRLNFDEFIQKLTLKKLQSTFLQNLKIVTFTNCHFTEEQIKDIKNVLGIRN